MKMSVTDAEIVVRNRVLEKNLLLPVTFDLHTMEDASAAGLGSAWQCKTQAAGRKTS